MNVLVISQVRLLRDAFLRILSRDRDIRAFEAPCRKTVEAMMMMSHPLDVIIIDALHSEGTALLALIRARQQNVAVVVLSMREQDEGSLASTKTKIAGYLGPDTSAADLLSTVRRAAAGAAVYPPRPAALSVSGCAKAPTDHASQVDINALTLREREVIALLAEGMSNKLIARRLGIALPTVQNHVHNILDKWDVRGRGEAAARFRQTSHQSVEPNGRKLVAMRASHISQMGGPTLRHGPLRMGSPSFPARNAA